MYKLIMLPNPILVSDEEIEKGDWFYYYSHGKFNMYMCEGVVGKSLVVQNKESSCWSDYSKKIIAGIDTKLDLSAIAEKIGWVDVEKLAYQKFKMIPSFNNGLIVNSDTNYFERKGWIDGFKAAQSLNEKKFSEKDLYNLLKLIGQKGYYVECDGIVYANAFDGGDIIDVVKEYSEAISKPKEYNVEVDMEDIGNKDKVYNCSSKSEWIPKITNNTIKVTKILS